MAVKKASKKSSKKPTRKSSGKKSAPSRAKKSSSRSRAPAKKSRVAAKPSRAKNSAPRFSNAFEIGAFILRIGLGLYFIIMGLILTFNHGNYQTLMVDVLNGMSASSALLQLSFIGFLVMGFCLLLGLFTRYIGLLASIVTIIGLLSSWNATMGAMSVGGSAYMIKNLVIIAAGLSLYYTGSKNMSVEYAL